MKVLITGSSGLIGAECVRLFSGEGWDVAGIDNNMREVFFGSGGSTGSTTEQLKRTVSRFRHFDVDIRDRKIVRELMDFERPDCIIHTAAQPSHDKAASIPYEDFDVNAGGTLNLLVAARDFCKEAPFCFTSTNKVYGDRPNHLPLIERESRWDYADGRDGIDETMSIDQCLHSVFGASKLAADVMCQEFGRYFNMPVGVFRGGCLTGPQHAAVQLHGYLAYITLCAVTGKRYTVFGYKGKQVRDQIHCRDVARLMLEFSRNPRAGEVYNMGGGRANSVSVLETIDILASHGYKLEYDYNDVNRAGDHLCYISDLRKIQAHFPDFRLAYDLPRIFDEILSEKRKTAVAPYPVSESSHLHSVFSA